MIHNFQNRQEPRFILMRALAICLVVYIHSSGDLAFSAVGDSASSFLVFCIHAKQIIYTAVPLFVMVSGALLLGKQEEISVFFSKRAKRVLIPFLVWSPIVFILTCYKEGTPLRWESCVQCIWLIVSKGAHGIYWYIYLILSLYLLTPFLRIIVKHSSYRMIAFLCALPLLSHYLGSYIPEISLTRGCHFSYDIYIFYYIIGYLLFRLYNDGLLKISASACGKLGAIAGCSAIALLVYVGPQGMDWAVIPASVGLYFLLLNTPQSLAEKLATSTSLISKMSYGIYLSHFILISFVLRSGVFTSCPIWIRGICIAGTVIILNMVILWVLDKCRLSKWFM